MYMHQLLIVACVCLVCVAADAVPSSTNATSSAGGLPARPQAAKSITDVAKQHQDRWGIKLPTDEFKNALAESGIRMARSAVGRARKLVILRLVSVPLLWGCGVFVHVCMLVCARGGGGLQE